MHTASLIVGILSVLIGFARLGLDVYRLRQDLQERLTQTPLAPAA